MPTPHLGLPYIDQGQAQKEVTHNLALKLLDGIVQLSVKDRTTTTPPSSPIEGDRWIIPAGATGMWAGKTNQIALWTDAAWTWLVPLAGWVCYIEPEGVVVYAGGAWGAPLGSGGGGITDGDKGDIAVTGCRGIPDRHSCPSYLNQEGPTESCASCTCDNGAADAYKTVTCRSGGAKQKAPRTSPWPKPGRENRRRS